MYLPDGPKTSVLIQNIQFLLRPLETLDSWQQEYGDTFRLRGNEMPPLIYFSSPEAIQKIFTSEPEYLGSIQKSDLVKLLLGENSIIFLGDERHHRQRRMLLPPFHSERMRWYSQVICEITEEVINRLSPGSFFIVQLVVKEISMRVILNVVFGLQAGERQNKIRCIVNSLFESFDNPLSQVLWSFLPIIKNWGILNPQSRLIDQLDQEIYALIAERKMSKARDKDILSMLIEARDEFGKAMTDIELRDSLVTLLFAGYETTVSAISWALYWSHYLPEIQARLLFELRANSNKDKNEVARLPYLNAVCSETLRLYPIALNAFARFVKQPIEIAGYYLEPPTIVNVSVYLAHQRQEVYREPKKFIPERFLERQFSPYEYLPFGGGSRRCVGAALAQLQIKLVLATILSRLQLSLVSNQALKPVRRGIIMSPPSLEMIVKGIDQKGLY
ncbi:cytochrome P450 [Nostoc sp. FACHB-87]|uniref:cytochrome P450 n=1 Tax=Nostocales TaxID=1161 RepID=UPI001687A847|nr:MULTISPECIES: cytochrome P450 [Nostocales]MBD2303476.1 cytochrome P450 [Nostoc sp. FACHB-190]MBD2457327.1 cytochrome P450 [Nostoc sp. FACHB-87]MBD2478396.1 cytochrome P450 [Anabaena sp. FACHB-83]MBD2491218.1 cytochrome P450 [Aulosira sp. FACHB-615]